MSLIIPGQGGGSDVFVSPEIITTPTGVLYRFTQSTKPTQRAPGVSLGIGDQWENSGDGTEWFWNGTYWLSPVRFESYLAQWTSTPQLDMRFQPTIEVPEFVSRILVKSVTITYNYVNQAGDAAGATGINTTNNYFVFRPYIAASSNSGQGSFYASVSDQGITIGSGTVFFTRRLTPNAVIDISTVTSPRFALSILRTGTISLSTVDFIRFLQEYHWVHP